MSPDSFNPQPKHPAPVRLARDVPVRRQIWHRIDRPYQGGALGDPVQNGWSSGRGAKPALGWPVSGLEFAAVRRWMPPTASAV